jgi:hypothetical protein
MQTSFNSGGWSEVARKVGKDKYKCKGRHRFLEITDFRGFDRTAYDRWREEKVDEGENVSFFKD